MLNGGVVSAGDGGGRVVRSTLRRGGDQGGLGCLVWRALRGAGVPLDDFVTGGRLRSVLSFIYTQIYTGIEHIICCCFSHSASWLPTWKNYFRTMANSAARGLLNRENISL